MDALDRDIALKQENQVLREELARLAVQVERLEAQLAHLYEIVRGAA